PQKIGGPRAAEVSYHVPAFDADVARILNDFGERLNLLELVVAGTLHQALNGQRPGAKVDIGIQDIVIVVGKALERGHLMVAEGAGQAMAAKELAGCPVAEGITLV